MAIYEFHSCRLDTSDGSLRYLDDGTRHSLRPQIERLLRFFLDHPDQVLSRDAIVPAIWGPKTVVDFESGLAALIRELRTVLDECGGQSGLIETIPRRGYRFRGPVSRVDQAKDSRPKRSVIAAWLAASLFALGVGLAIGWWLWTGPDVPDEVAITHSLAILPPERYGEIDRPPEQAGILLADTLLARLWTAELDDLELIGRTSMRPYDGQEDVGRAVAADLGVNLLMEGSLVADEDGWTVEIRLLALPEGRVVWSMSIQRADTGRLPVSEVADELIGGLTESWPEIREKIPRQTES